MISRHGCHDYGELKTTTAVTHGCGYPAPSVYLLNLDMFCGGRIRSWGKLSNIEAR